MIVHRMGERALLVEVEDGAAAQALHAECVRRRAAGVLVAEEIVPGARTVLLDGIGGTGGIEAPRQADGFGVEALARSLPHWRIPPVETAAGPQVEIPVIFDGPDVADVARHWGVGAGDVGRIVTSAELTVAFCGFAPGFAYLGGLGREVPRRQTPRTAVPTGAVGLAGEYAGVYPRRSPGGWQIIGTAVDVLLWDVAREPAALLAPGTRVRFVEAP